MKNQTAWFQKHAFGSEFDKQICKMAFGYTHTLKNVAATSNTAVLAATATATTAQTVTTGITNPDVPRNLVVKPGGTAADLGSGTVVVHGTNWEGAAISEEFGLTDGATTAITGNKAFKTVTSVVIPICDGTGATISVGVGNKLGIKHRVYTSNTTVKVVKDVAGTRTLDTTPTLVADEYYLEENVVTPATVPDGSTSYSIYYILDVWSLGDTNDNPAYFTATSTSTSTSSTSSSTSSTSSSTSSTSTSSTSSSTSSTSTSTTTVP